MKTRMVRLDPRDLKLLDRNARFMRYETFQRLVDNVKQDDALTSVPFAWQVHDDASRQPLSRADGNPLFEVLSGNHRVKAAISADLPEIDVMITEEYLAPDQRLAIQLSHNELTGEDDPAILKTLYSEIISPIAKLYSGLDDKRLALLDRVQIGSLAEANLSFQTVSMVFLPEEIEAVNAAWDQAKKTLAGQKFAWLNSLGEYDKLLDAIEVASQSHGIKNTATCLMLVLEVFSRHLTDLAEGWYDEATGQPLKGVKRVPIATILGSETVPASVGAALKKAIDRMTGKGEASQRGEALQKLAQAYLEAEKAERQEAEHAK